MITNDFIKFVEELYPDAHCELNYDNDYQLLVNIALSAQTTDKKVNEISKDLFLIYPNVNSLANANEKELIEIIKPLGLSKVKSSNLIDCAKQIKTLYNGKIPNVHCELTKLKGVGNKTANVFLAEYYNIPTFAVDTHVKRVANRLNFSKSENVDIIEKDLMKLFPKDNWIKLHHQFIFFGRYFCKSKSPNCEQCKIKNTCLFILD